MQGDEDSSVASRATDNDGKPILKTKRQFKEQYAAIKAHQDHMLSIIGSRESQISALDGSINSINESSLRCLMWMMRVMSRWCLSYRLPPDMGKNIGSVQLLVNWSSRRRRGG